MWRNVTFLLRFALIAALLHAGASMSFAAAQGWFEDDCSGATLNITKFAQASGGQVLVLRWNSSHIPVALLAGEGWLDVKGKRCASTSTCEEAIETKISITDVKRSGKRISGKYAADFGGQHLEEQFVVKYRKHKGPPFICE